MRSALALLLCLASIPAEGRRDTRPQQQQPVFPSEIELVALDVGVVDEHGRPVDDLHAEDFEIRVGKKPRKLLSAEFLSHTGDAPAPASPMPAHYSTNEGLASGRLLVLVVDEANIGSGAGALAARAAEKLLDRLGRADRVALLTMPGPLPREDFTTDHARIRAALKSVAGKASPSGRRVSLREAVALVMNEDGQRWRESVARLCGEGHGCSKEVESEAREVWGEYQAQSTRSAEMLRATFDMLGTIEGAKTMVLVTQGLGLPGAATRSALGELQQLAAAARAARVGFFSVLVDPPLASAESEGRIPAQQLLEDRDLQLRGLDYLADRIGGAALRATPEHAFERIAREMSGRYQLGFEPDAKDRDGKGHELTVKVRRPGVTVRVGREVTIPKRGAERDERAQLVALLRSPVVATELKVRISTWTLKDVASGKLRLMMETETGSGRAPDAASVAYLLLNDKGKTAGAAMLARTQGSGASGGTSLVVEPGQYTLRVAARDERGRVGSVVHAAAAALQSGDELEVSDLLLGPAPERGRPFRPAPDPHAERPNGALGAHIELYAHAGSQLDAVVVWVDVIRSDGATAVKSVRAQLGGAQHSGRRIAQALIPSAGLEPGDYVARAHVLAGDQEIATVARPFRIVG